MKPLDAYGHLAWTVGNEDWIACFDARRVGNKIEYHVVVDCESGGFTDTMEHGEVDIGDANAVSNLKSMPSYWADVCSEHYIDTEEYGPVEWEDTETSWAAHIDALCATESEDSDEDEEAAWYEELNRGYARDRI